MARYKGTRLSLTVRVTSSGRNKGSSALQGLTFESTNADLSIVLQSCAMYWPVGAPRVYAASKLRKKSSETGGSNGVSEAESNEQDAVALLGLRASRHGHLFATITATALTIWHTSV